MSLAPFTKKKNVMDFFPNTNPSSTLNFRNQLCSSIQPEFKLWEVDGWCVWNMLLPRREIDVDLLLNC